MNQYFDHEHNEKIHFPTKNFGYDDDLFCDINNEAHQDCDQLYF